LLIILVLTERKLETLIASLRATDLDIMKLWWRQRPGSDVCR